MKITLGYFFKYFVNRIQGVIHINTFKNEICMANKNDFINLKSAALWWTVSILFAIRAQQKLQNIRPLIHTLWQ